jgi:hypothetical protein
MDNFGKCSDYNGDPDMCFESLPKWRSRISYSSRNLYLKKKEISQMHQFISNILKSMEMEL